MLAGGWVVAGLLWLVGGGGRVLAGRYPFLDVEPATVATTPRGVCMRSWTRHQVLELLGSVEKGALPFLPMGSGRSARSATGG